MATLRVGGFDPSYTNFGMVKLDLDLEEGEITTPILNLEQTAPDNKNKSTMRKNVDDLMRCQKLYKAAIDFFEDVDVICVEMPVGSQSANSMKSYGICIALTAALNKPLIYLTATEVKLAGAGGKNSTKKEMIDWATSEFPEANWITRKEKGKQVYQNCNEHLADALAAIYAGVNSEQFNIYKRLLT